jgi:hypothetical protein
MTQNNSYSAMDDMGGNTFLAEEPPPRLLNWRYRTLDYIASIIRPDPYIPDRSTTIAKGWGLTRKRMN